MELKTFHDAINYLESLKPETGSKLYIGTLDRINDLLERLGNPQRGINFVHVGGTAGKGSTCYMIAAMLQAAGYKTGLHVSPHIEDVRERLQINGQFIREDQFVAYVHHIAPVMEAMRATSPHGAPSYFEALLAIAFQYFKDKKVDIAVVEVGMGGTLDGTNVITPKVAVLTNVGLDHTQFLGDTVEKIAHDKVGIFKMGIDVVSGVTQPSVRAIVRAKAKGLGCYLQLLGDDFDKNIPATIHVPYQRKNASLAIAAIRALKKHGFTVSDDVIQTSLASVKIPGRFEIFPKLLATNYQLPVILDGAHNPDKVQALREAIAVVFPDKKIRFVFAAKKDKNIIEMIKILEPIAKKFYFTKFLQSTDFGKDFSFDPKEFSTTVGSEVFKTSDGALQKAQDESDKDDVICVTGSLYLVGEVRGYLKAK